ncbi:MAG: ABC transporter ATP-binding protein [Clostridia bacterium]|nr:ABC transporter ATP-binding protein [Clostridia bacterium]
MKMLEIKDLKKRFGAKQVLNGVDLKVPEHSVFGFVGQNGAGKTTTMKMILGLLASDEGEIYINGERVTCGSNKTNKYVGYLPDVPEFYDYMTATEYLDFCGSVTGMGIAQKKERIKEMLILVGLEKEEKRIKGFSRGMKQRLGIAQALLNKPLLLICDEPTSALDPVGRKEILEVLSAAKQDTTVLFSTHILSDIEKICDHIALLHDGKILLSGTMEEVKNTHKNRDSQNLELSLSSVSEVQLAGLMDYLQKNNICVTEMQEGEWNLESLFMKVVEK